MDRFEFGQRLKAVRRDVLNLSQGGFAYELGVIQPLVSRLESGMGGTIELLFQIVEYFYKKGYPAYCLFYKNFDIENFKPVSYSELSKTTAASINEDVSQLKGFLTAALENTKTIEALIKAGKK